MYITIDLLEKYNACDNGKQWFKRFFPNGGELMEVITHKFVTPEILHWGYTYLPTTPEEQKIYWEKLHIECENIHAIYESDNIYNSNWVSRSSHVKNSNYIFSSNNIENSENVFSGKDVKDSNKIFNSEFVYSSKKVLQSKNINDSSNIINSDYVVNSNSVINSIAVKNSSYVVGMTSGGSKQIKNSFFIVSCTNLNHCLFCHNIHEKECFIFNKQFDKTDYELITNQIKDILNDYEMELVKNNKWGANTIPLDSPTTQRNFTKQFAGLPDKFWRWVKTLPGYDPTILYAITYNKDLL